MDLVHNVERSILVMQILSTYDVEVYRNLMHLESLGFAKMVVMRTCGRLPYALALALALLNHSDGLNLPTCTQKRAPPVCEAHLALLPGCGAFGGRREVEGCCGLRLVLRGGAGGERHRNRETKEGKEVKGVKGGVSKEKKQKGGGETSVGAADEDSMENSVDMGYEDDAAPAVQQVRQFFPWSPRTCAFARTFP